MNLYIKDTNGKPSASLTLSMIAFILVALWFLISFINVKIGTWTPKPFNEASALAFLIPCLSLYWGRRFSDDKLQLSKPTKEEQAEQPGDTENTEVSHPEYSAPDIQA